MLCKKERLAMAFLAATLLLPPKGYAQDFSGTHLAGTSLSYPMPPFTYEGSQVVSVTFRTSPELLRAMVPEPLVPAETNEVSVSIVHHHIVAPMPLSYYEAFLLIPVSHQGSPGQYIPVLYLDDAAAIIGGREIWGFSKFGGEIRMVEEGGEVRATVQQAGVTLIEVSVHPGDPLAAIPEPPNLPIFNVKIIPSVEEGAPPEVKQLTATTMGNPKIAELRPGAGTLSFGSTPVAPLGSIPVLEILGASWYKYGFTLDYGTIVHDYLAEGG